MRKILLHVASFFIVLEIIFKWTVLELVVYFSLAVSLVMLYEKLKRSLSDFMARKALE